MAKSGTRSDLNKSAGGTAIRRAPTGNTSRQRPVRATKYKTKARRGGSGGMIGLVVCLALIGGGIYFAPELINQIRRADFERSRTKQQDNSKADVEFVTRMVDSEGRDLSKRSGGSEAFNQKYDQAKSQAEKGEFGAARNLFLEAAQDKGGLKAKAQEAADTCGIFAELLGQSAGSPDSARREQLLAEKIKTEREGVAYYLLAKKMVQAGLKDDACALLTDAFKLSPRVKAELDEHQAHILFKTGVWFLSQDKLTDAERVFSRLFADYPLSQAAGDARQALEDAKAKGLAINLTPPPAGAATGTAAGPVDFAGAVRQESRANSELDKRVTGKDQGKLDQAEQLLTSARKLFDEGKEVSSRAKSNELYTKAEKQFEQTLQIYRQAADKDPQNQALENRIQETSKLLYWCRKMKRL